MLLLSKPYTSIDKAQWRSINATSLCAGFVGLLAWLLVANAWASESQFMAAAQAFKQKDKTTLQQLSQDMAGDVLAGYPEYFLLYLDLPYLSPETVIAYASKYKDTASAEKLAADYVEEKVKRGELREANAVAKLVQNPDSEEACALAVAKSSAGDYTPLLRLMPNVWYRAQQAKTCVLAAQAITRNVKVDTLQLQHRLWALLLQDELTAASADAQYNGWLLPRETLFDAKRNPQTYLNASDLSYFAAQSTFIVALAKVARTQGVATAEQTLQALQANLPTALKAYAYRVIALCRIEKNVDQGFEPKVVGWFDQSLNVPFSEFEAEKYAMHAVREGKWDSVLYAIDVMSEVQKEQVVWQYWFARASDNMANPRAKEIAMDFYQAISQSDDQYYGLLANARLGRSNKRIQYQVSDKDREKLAQNSAFNRAFALKQIDADETFVNREWNWAVRQAMTSKKDNIILAAAERAHQMQWYDRAIYAADRTQKLKNDNLAYPVPFKDEILAASNEFGADPAWVYGLMRQESRFKTNARSHVGASGLMQIMPATNRWVAHKLGASAGDMTPSKNIRFGTFYIQHVYKQLGAQAVLATAGYNGGPSRAKRWQPDNTSMASDQYVEAIPFSETRDYVKNVMSNAVYYNQVLQMPPSTISERMGIIAPKNNVSIEGP